MFGAKPNSVCAAIVSAVFAASSGSLRASDKQQIPTPAAQEQTAGSIQTADRSDEILKELRELRLLIESQISGNRAPAKARLEQVDGQALGSAGAPVTMVEFSDLECPFCRQYYMTSFQEIRKEYIETGKVRYIVQDFPLETIHANAIPAAKAAQCGGQQDKFWEVRLGLSAVRALNEASIRDVAKRQSLDMRRFNECMAANSVESVINKHKERATVIGVTGTPTFVIGRTAAGQGGVDGVVLVGALKYSRFKATIDDLLKDK